MPGTVATFAGIPCFDVRFTRSRGWSSDVSSVEIPASVAEGLGLLVPRAGDLARPRAGAAGNDLGPGGPVQLAAEVPYEGALVLAETVGGQSWSVTVPNLFVSRAEVVREADGTPTARVRLYLVDVRYFWPRGIMPRFSFNRRRADGTFAKDAVRADESAIPRREIADLAASSMFRAPRIAAAPVEWASDGSPIEFPAFDTAVLALGLLAGKAGIEEPALRLDGDIALHKIGDGFVGYASDGRGANKVPLPLPVRLYKDGAGQALSTENTYPDEWTLVVGGERIASVALDKWEPVLFEEDGNKVVPLKESTIRRLTGDRYGLDWVQRFVLSPSDVQHVVGLDDRVTRLIQEQAYRLFRLPGAVVGVEDPVTGIVRYEPGPNAHLLPLLDRAETSGGRRLPPKVETYRWAHIRQPLLTSAAAAELVRLRDELAALRETVNREANKRGGRINNPFSSPRKSLTEEFTAADIFGAAFDAVPPEELRALDRDLLVDALNSARLVQRIAESEAGPTLAQKYAELLRKTAEAQDAVAGTNKYTTAFDLGTEAAAVEKQSYENEGGLDLIAAGTAGDDLDVARRKRLEAIRGPLANKLRQAGLDALQEQEETRTRTRLGAVERNDDVGATILANQKRMEDVRARVFAPELGIIETSELAGLVIVDPTLGITDPVPTNESHAMLVPAPVRVTFGAVVRPRTDRAARTALGRPVTGTDERANLLMDQPRLGRPEAQLKQEALQRGEGASEPDIIPACLSDQETYYTAAFQRQGDGAPKLVELSALPFDQVVRIGAGELVELVTLDGASNRSGLDRDARAIVFPRMKIPDQLKTLSTTLARPWPVQCDGVVSSVEITMRKQDNAPCGFETTIVSGGAVARPRDTSGATQTDPARRGAAALAAQNAADRREGKR